MAFSRCSSLTSLNSFDVKSVHSSVNSEYSMIITKRRNEHAGSGGDGGGGGDEDENDQDEDDEDLDKLMPESPAAANNSFKMAQRIMHKQQQLQYRQSAILAMSGGDLKALIDQPADPADPVVDSLDGAGGSAVSVTKNAPHFTLHTPPVKLMAQSDKFAAAPPSSAFVSSGVGSFGLAPGGSFAQPMQFNFQNPRPIHVNKSMPSALNTTAQFGTQNGAVGKPFAFLKNTQTQFNGMLPLPPPPPPQPPKFLINRQLNMVDGSGVGFSKPAAPSWQLPLMPSTSVSSSLDSEDVPVVFGQCRTPRFKQPNAAAAAAESVSSSHQNSPPESVCSHMSSSSVPSVIRDDLNSKNQRFNTYLDMLNGQSSLFPRANRDKSQHYFMLNTPSSSASSSAAANNFNDTLVGGQENQATTKTTGLKLIEQAHDASHLERHFMRSNTTAAATAQVNSDSDVLDEESGAAARQDEVLSSERPSFLDDDEQPRTFVTEETPNQSILNEPKAKTTSQFLLNKPLSTMILAQNQTINRDGTVTEFSNYFSQMSLKPPPSDQQEAVFNAIADNRYRFNQKQVPFNFVERSAHMEQQIAQQAVKMAPPFVDAAATSYRSAEAWSFQNNFTPAAQAWKNLEDNDRAEMAKQQQQGDQSSEPEEPFDQSKEETSIMKEHDDRPFDVSDDELILQNFIDEMLPHVISNASSSSSSRQTAAVETALVSSPAYNNCKINTSLNEFAESSSHIPNNTPISTINLAVKPPLIVKRASLNIKQHHYHHHETAPWMTAGPGTGAGIKFPKRNSNGSAHELAQSTHAAFLAASNETRASALADRTNRLPLHAHHQSSVNSAHSGLNLSNLSTNSLGSHGNNNNNKGSSGASSIENSCKLAVNEGNLTNKSQFKKRLSAEGFDSKPDRHNLSPSLTRKLTSKLSASKLSKPATIAFSSSSNGINTSASSRPALNSFKQATTTASSKTNSSVQERMNSTISSHHHHHPVITMTKTAQLRANANQAKKPAGVVTATSSSNPTVPKILTTNLRAFKPTAAATVTSGRAGKTDLNETHGYEAKKVAFAETSSSSSSNSRRKSLVLDKPGILPSSSTNSKPKPAVAMATGPLNRLTTTTSLKAASRPAFKAK